MIHYVKPTQVKQPAQIIVLVGLVLTGQQNLNEIAHEVVEFANLIKTSGNNVIVSSRVSRKD